MRPLEGLVVLDISRALAGPYCTMMLGDMGADVIKVERPGKGDDSRSWGPPFVGEPYSTYPGESAYFMAINRNKRSVTINLKDPEGQAIVRELAANSDILVENFRTGALEKLGLGYEDIHALNPGLIYCSISGYGRTGPYANRPGYDFIIQAEGGLMGVTGPEEGPPFRAGLSIIDITTGMFACSAILAALHAREQTREGQLIDTSLLDSAVGLLANVASNYLIGGVEPPRMGNAHLNIAPYEVFRARDRWFTLAAANSIQWEALCKVIGRPDLKDEPRFADNRSRMAERVALVETLNEIFATRDADEWLVMLQQAGIPSGPINTIKDVFNHPQMEARQLKIEIEHPTAGPIATPGIPYKMSQTPVDVRRPPPLLGEHTEEVLSEKLGYTADEIAHLRDHKAI